MAATCPLQNMNDKATESASSQDMNPAVAGHESYLSLLNDQQRAAVEYIDGPSLVIAGAGSGKTRVLTYKILHLLTHGYEPYRILALTFTNKAAREMKERIRQVAGERAASRLWMGTFHSIFLRILRQHADKLGYKQSFTIYDSNDSKSLVKMIIKDMGLDDKIYKASAVAAAISNAKNALIDAESYAHDAGCRAADTKARRPEIWRIYAVYQERCRVADAMDFDDILFNMNLLLRDFPEVTRHYQEYFKYILVDEYQDTNFAQHLIIKQLSAVSQQLCVVGDDAQSIYSFRGANIGNILSMQEQYPGLEIFKLERNYRSTQNIINAAGSLIDKNTRQMRKNVYSENDKGEPIKVVKTYSDFEEAYTVAGMLSEKKLTFHDSYEDYAILYRTNAQSRVLEESLRKRGVPYRIYGGLSFYQRKEIKDAICYFRLAINPDDDEALRRVINYPRRGIGDTTVKKLISCATEHHISIWQVITHQEQYGLDVNAATARKLRDFALLIQTFIDDNASGSTAFELGQLIYNRTGMLTTLMHDSTPESISQQENLSELLSGLTEFVDTRREEGEEDLSMAAFLSEVSLATDQDESEEDNSPKVTLMTVHAAKGLEFKHVFIVGVEEELFPAAMSMDSLEQVEEERRLLYVAITRAKVTCTLTYAGTRFRNGSTALTRPSRFLGNIDTRYLKATSSVDIFDQKGASRQSDPIPTFTRPQPRAYVRGPQSGTQGAGKGVSQGGYRGGYGSGGSYGSGRSYGSVSGAPSAGGMATGGRKVSVNLSDSQDVSSVAGGHVVVGTRIRHDRFGEGTVRKLESASGSEVMTVDFGAIGIKKLLLKYAKFTIIS